MRGEGDGAIFNLTRIYIQHRSRYYGSSPTKIHQHSSTRVVLRRAKQTP